jgi:hypothetical protein
VIVEGLLNARPGAVVKVVPWERPQDRSKAANPNRPPVAGN